MAQNSGHPPLYARVRAAIEQYIANAELGEDDPIPPESELVNRLGVSRGTIRRALDELEEEGLLLRQSGRGTFLNPAARLRSLVSARLRDVARPDSRFDMDFRMFAPDFEGSEICLSRTIELPCYRSADNIFVPPDNALRGFQAQALGDGKTVIAGTYGMRRGFVRLQPHAIDAAARQLAATLDGQERFGESLALEALRDIGTIDLVVTGAIAVSEDGFYSGRGEGYFDLEWGLLSELGLVTAQTTAIAIVHDCQIVPARALHHEFDCVLDIVVTPTRVLYPQPRRPKPTGIYWEHISPKAAALPYLSELRRSRTATLVNPNHDGAFDPLPISVLSRT